MVKIRPSVPLNPRSMNWRCDSLKPMMLLPRVAVLQWLSLRVASVSLRLNLDLSNLRLLTLTRVTKRLSAKSRNFNSNKMKTTRTKIACLTWPANCKLRSRLTRHKLKKPRKLLPSTWPSSARLNKIWRKLRQDPKWPVPHLLLFVAAQFSKPIVSMECKGTTYASLWSISLVNVPVQYQYILQNYYY